MAMPRRCEDCALKAPNFGLLAEGKKRWCAGCAKAHAGAQSMDTRVAAGSGRGSGQTGRKRGLYQVNHCIAAPALKRRALAKKIYSL